MPLESIALQRHFLYVFADAVINKEPAPQKKGTGS